MCSGVGSISIWRLLDWMPIAPSRRTICWAKPATCGVGLAIISSSRPNAFPRMLFACAGGFGRRRIWITICRWAMTITRQATWLSDYDLYLFGEGTHHRAYEKLGAHLGEMEGRRGVHCAVWAPNAEKVTVIGEFNAWNPRS